MVKNCGASVTFHILDEASYKKAKAKGIKWPDQTSQTAPVDYGLPKDELKPKLCYLVKTNSDFGFSLHSVKGEQGRQKKVNLYIRRNRTIKITFQLW